jgi:cysteine desulfurase
MQPIYLDHNATTPILPEVVAAMAECQSAAFANPESQHRLGRRARRALEDAREGIAEILGADLTGRHPDLLLFTSGGTEANNLALFGLTGGLNSAGGRILISSIEHPSVAEPARFLTRRGWQVDRLPVSRDGVIEKGDILRYLPDDRAGGADEPQKSRMSPFFLSVMLANNETGVMQPIRELAAACRAAGVPLHTDAVQAIGKVPVNFRELGVTAMTIAAHKFHGPRGIGALVVRGGTSLAPHLFGGFQQNGLRPGTEPVALAVGMHVALRIFAREQAERRERITRLRDRFEAALLAAYPSAVIHGAAVERLPNTTCIAFPGLDRQALVMALDMAGIACSTGSACASGSSEPSPTLVAMGLSNELISSSIRFSLGATTTAEMIDEAIERIVKVLSTSRMHSGSS